LWHAYVPESQVWPPPEFETIVMRYRLSVGDLAAVARRAPGSAREAADFCREATRHHLGELAKPLECPFGWDDLVVTDKLRESLEDFAFEARDRTAFWEMDHVRRLFPRGTGLVGLFNGPPGTGKTMAAQVIAADLQLDVVRVDLASVVSKYIGETAKHLARIFARAAKMNAVLLFDEADALFSKRTEVKDSHDRYANTDTSYLLQLLEEHDGIVILATNKKQNIDPAFIRRIRYVFDFPRPEAGERGKIWSKLIGDLAGSDALMRLEIAIGLLAGNVECSGAQIKNAVLAGMFACRRNSEPLSLAHLLRGVERELSKEGRALGAHERERLMRHA
jgi:SpoVK/Ycf46/Vps4 family AAA+-type ATPase